MASGCVTKPGQLLLIALIGIIFKYFYYYFFLLFLGQSLGFVVELNKDPIGDKGRAYTRYNDEFPLPTFSLTICMRFLPSRILDHFIFSMLKGFTFCPRLGI